MDTLEIFSFLAACESDGEQAVLVTLVASTGPTMRALGGHMAVRADGDYVGAVSAGCIEAAIVAEALEALEMRQPRTVRFGQVGRPVLVIALLGRRNLLTQITNF